MNEPAALPEPTVPEGDGLVFGLSDVVYHAAPGLSNSDMKKLMQSPKHYRHYKDSPRSEPTDAMMIGTYLHAAVLEPERFERDFMCAPGDAPNRPTSRQINAKKPSPETLSAISFWRDFDAANAGKTILTPADMFTVQSMAQAIADHPTAGPLLSAPGRSEASAFWTDAELGIRCKARFDRVLDDAIIADVKTCEDASYAAVAATIARYCYYLQDAHYQEGFRSIVGEFPRAFVFVFIEKTAPYGIGLYVVDPAGHADGIELRRSLMMRYAECERTGIWPGYPDSVQSVTLSSWAVRAASNDNTKPRE